MTTFYVVSAGASATLVGLLFVAVQIGPDLVTRGRVGPRHAIARSTFTVFAVILVLSLLFLVPQVSSRVRAIYAMAAAAAGTARAVRTWIPVWRDMRHGRAESRLWQTVWLLVGPFLGYALLAEAAGRELATNVTGTLDIGAGYAFVLLFVVALRNSWNLLVEGRTTDQRQT
jgi:hypothetical protein